MLCWRGIECWSEARAQRLGPPKLLVSAPELELEFPIPQHVCRSLHCALPNIEVDSNSNTTISTGLKNQTKIIGGGGNSFIFQLNASALFSPWVIHISYGTRQRLDFTDYFFFFSLGFIAGKVERECNCFCFHIPVIMIIFNLTN